MGSQGSCSLSFSSHPIHLPSSSEINKVITGMKKAIKQQNGNKQPKILHCTSKQSSCRTLVLVVGVFSQHFFLGRRPETLSLGGNSCRDNLAPKLEKGLGLQLCPCAWCYPEPRNSRFLLAPNGLFFFSEFREDTPLPASE